jgi:hypothetical protein
MNIIKMTLFNLNTVNIQFKPSMIETFYELKCPILNIRWYNKLRIVFENVF